MATKAGVWIDHKQAIVVLITDTGEEIKNFNADGDQSSPPVVSTHLENKPAPHGSMPEDRRDHKLDNDRRRVYDEVLVGIHGADALLILGPGEAKGELHKHILAKKVHGLTVEVETADKMTDQQLTAKVSEHFNLAAARKSGAAEKMVTAGTEKRHKIDE